MIDKPTFDRLPDQIKEFVAFSTSERIRKTWGDLARIIYKKQSEDYKKLPIVVSIDNPKPYTPDSPVVIPLNGGGRLEIGRIQNCYSYEGKQEINETDLLLRIHAPSHRSSDQDEGKTLDYELSISPYGSGLDIQLLSMKTKDLNSTEYQHSIDARKYMALFNPEKDIAWEQLTQPTETQNIILQQAGFHPPTTLPAA